jgi:hypothetical protein
VRSFSLSRTVAVAGDTVRMTLQVSGGARQRADFAVALETATGEQALTTTRVGLPASAPLADGLMTVNWPVRTSGLTLPARVVVRMGNQPLKLDQLITLQPVDGPGDGGLPQMPIVRVRIPGPTGGFVAPPGASGLPGGSAGAPAALELRQVGSVPGLGGLGFVVGMPEAGPARLDVYDVLGRHVRSLAGGDLPRGYTLESWDGRDGEGRTARRGIYFVRLSTAHERATLRVLRID